MVIRTVNKKLPPSLALAGLAVLTLLASWARLFPPSWVERIYSRAVFPWISGAAGFFANAAPFSWLDVWILVAVGLLVYSIRRRRWRLLLGGTSFFYLWFFWGWGLNYHRPSVASRLHLETRGLADADFSRFTERTARELNRLWPLASQKPLGREEIGLMAAGRVGRVVLRIDGTDWPSASRVKRPRIAELWYRIAGVDGMFNPFGHEPLVIAGPLPFELPFLMSHELAHVRGVANEGEANLVALFATLASEDFRFQYSGWLEVWAYLGADASTALDSGPRADLVAIAERLRANQIPAISRVQSAILDAHLKANAVPAGIHSYSEFVSLAIASQQRWEEFR